MSADLALLLTLSPQTFALADHVCHIVGPGGMPCYAMAQSSSNWSSGPCLIGCSTRTLPAAAANPPHFPALCTRSAALVCSLKVCEHAQHAR